MNATVIAIAANLILGSGVFDQIKAAVIAQESKLLSGTEKKNAVVAQLAHIGVDTTNNLINLGIELAVAWLNAKK
jgi:hypothetical protein